MKNRNIAKQVIRLYNIYNYIYKNKDKIYFYLYKNKDKNKDKNIYKNKIYIYKNKDHKFYDSFNFSYFLSFLKPVNYN